MKFYNVILQQLRRIVNVVTIAPDEVFNEYINVLKESPIAIQFDDLIRLVCDRNDRAKYYVGERFKLRENIKLRPILETLRNHNQVITVD